MCEKCGINHPDEILEKVEKITEVLMVSHHAMNTIQEAIVEGDVDPIEAIKHAAATAAFKELLENRYEQLSEIVDQLHSLALAAPFKYEVVKVDERQEELKEILSAIMKTTH